jgi:hypothetical protein
MSFVPSRKSARHVLFALALLAGFGATSSVAEDIDPNSLFDSAKASFGQKKYGKALQDLGILLKEIGRMRVEVLKGTLPGAPEGWTAQDAEGEAIGFTAFLGGGAVTVRRDYKKGDEANVQIQLLVDAPMIAVTTMALSNPGFLPPNSSIVTVKGKRAILRVEKDDKSGELSLPLNGNTTLVQISGHGISKADLETFGNAIDTEKMERTLQE